MSKNVDLRCTDKKLLEAAAELAPTLGLRFTSRGVPVEVKTGDELSLRKSGEGFVLTYRKKNEFFRGLSLLGAAVSEGREHVETGKYDMLCYMADVSRNAVLNMNGAKEMIRILAAMGYDSLMLYSEDTYEVPEYPYFGRMRGRYSAEELREIDDYADMFGIEVIPCMQTLAHLATALRWPGLNSIVDCNDIMLVGDERTYTFVRACLTTCRKIFRSKRINIGMDEAHMLGRGKYLTKNGYRPAHEIMLEHLDRVAAICAEIGYEPMMWSDMFFRMAFGGAYRVREGEIAPEIMAKVPSNVTLVYWDYYSLDRQIFDHMLECHLKFNNPTIFAGGAWKWSGFAPHNEFSLASTKLQLDSCAEHGVSSVIVTGWGDNGGEASQFSTLPTLLYFAERLYTGAEAPHELLEARSREVFGMGFDELKLFDLPNALPGTTPGECSHPVCPCKYLLYNDPLEGLMDRHVGPEAPEHYRRSAERLLAHADNERWGYIFESLGLLCDLLSDKCDLTIRIRRAYLDGDRNAVRRLAHEDIPAVIAKLDAFIVAFRRQWYAENKTFGFATEEQRLGGLRQRLDSVKLRLEAWLSGETDRIEELEQPVLSHDGRAADDPRTPYINYNSWAGTVTACLI